MKVGKWEMGTEMGYKGEIEALITKEIICRQVFVCLWEKIHLNVVL